MQQELETARAQEEGFVLLVLLSVLIPLTLVVGTFSVAMTGRSNEIRVEQEREHALLAAESGVDEAIFRGQIGTLADGVTFQNTLASDLTYLVTPTYLGADGVDNDGDLAIDEADEDVFQVVVTGSFRRTSRVIAAYLGPTGLLPSITSAVGMADASSVELIGTPLISGTNLNMDGTPGGVPAAVAGLSIADPATTATLLAELDPTEQTFVVGAGPAPSLGTFPAIDFASLAAQVQNAANLVLTSNMYSAYSFGNGPAGITNITYRNGDVTFSGNSRGAGILLVTGDLKLKGTFRFDGVIIVLGDIINSAGTVDVYGAILQGPGASLVEIKGTMAVHYSSQAIALANSMGGRYVSFNGWQELSN